MVPHPGHPSHKGALPGALPTSRASHQRRTTVTTCAIPETVEGGVEGYVEVLEQAYVDEAMGNEVRVRMVGRCRLTPG